MTGSVALASGARRRRNRLAARMAAVQGTPNGWLDLQRMAGNQAVCRLVESWRSQPAAVQRKVETGRLNVVGEWHDISDQRREEETEKLGQPPYNFGEGSYWTETDFTYGPDDTLGDSPELRMVQSALVLVRYLGDAKAKIVEVNQAADPRQALGELRDALMKWVVKEAVELAAEIIRVREIQADHPLVALALEGLGYVNALPGCAKRIVALQGQFELMEAMAQKREAAKSAAAARAQLMEEVEVTVDLARINLVEGLVEAGYSIEGDVDAVETSVTDARSRQMHGAADHAAKEGKQGVWKVGDRHVEDLLAMAGDKAYTLTREEDFNTAFGFPKTERQSVKS